MDCSLFEGTLRNRIFQTRALRRLRCRWVGFLAIWVASAPWLASAVAGEDDLFTAQVAPILKRHCLACHQQEGPEGGLSLASAAGLAQGSDAGPVIDADDWTSSRLLEVIEVIDGEAEMPLDAPPLSADDRAVLKRWVQRGAPWPPEVTLVQGPITETDWWSWRPLEPVRVPVAPTPLAAWPQNPVDAFVARQLQRHGLQPNPQAERRVLIRRLYFDLIGMAPSPREVEAFVESRDPRAYGRLVDQLLASPRYGERWARHWLDVVHYGDTHGYDKDKPRPNAWPYRDYVIRRLNEDPSYSRFIREQVAGDVLWPDSRDGVVATGFVAAGPWDFIGQVEVPEAKIDGQIARNLDRDDMVRNTIETFCSTTIGCARCHHHKFDPISMEDYYELQAVFARVDRAERPYDPDPEIRSQRQTFEHQLADVRASIEEVRTAMESRTGLSAQELTSEIEQLERQAFQASSERYGYHSQIAAQPDLEKWVQVDLDEAVRLGGIRVHPCYDEFAGIGAGFGFPIRYRVEVSSDPEFAKDVTVVFDGTHDDQPHPGVLPIRWELSGVEARYVRLTATRLAERQNDYILALGELQVWDDQGMLCSAGKTVTSLDSIEAPARWSRENLVDNAMVSEALEQPQLETLRARRQAWQDLQRQWTQSPEGQKLAALQAREAEILQALQTLPPAQRVYAAAWDFEAQGNFKPTTGQPREIHVLKRGNVQTPGERVEPQGLAALPELNRHFADLPDQPGAARVALANWLADAENPLTWRSVANRLWQYHFGRGIVDSPNDFGRMGQQPTHPELLDWLALQLRDREQSLKHLHRLVVTSATYQQTSDETEAAMAIDAGNQYYSRMTRQRMEAEVIRDAALQAAGLLDLRMYGPGFQDFVIDKPEHSPHYEYDQHDPADRRCHRRAIYRFIVRSQQQPFMTTLDCVDPSMQVEKRNETITPQQSLALLNNAFMLEVASRFAEDLRLAEPSLEAQIETGFRRVTGRAPNARELQVLVDYSRQHGLENTCRLLFNLNEFMFID